ncbi:MAG: DUF445 domain-containing protein [Gammaproteobacteria bacterium]|nr:DUF445 domain-containing protein [Gammaproteobacteria bacterium]MCF6231158.1 DUF445 domain-containing protein [Gammaproteobacteria bacterium]
MHINKSLLTNIVAIALIITGIYAPLYGEYILAIGIFALSGALTNWLAIYMLFEKIPLLYGSGVIPNRFMEFKQVIKQTIMEQFFTPENIQRFIAQEESNNKQLLDLEPLLKVVDYDHIFDNLVDAIMNSSFGSMLGMMGGASSLDSLKEPVTLKLQESLRTITQSETFHTVLHASLNNQQLGNDITRSIERIVDQRLDELSPQQVKEIVQRIIREHLGWLVVWGGVFGGLIGLLFSLTTDVV